MGSDRRLLGHDALDQLGDAAEGERCERLGERPHDRQRAGGASPQAGGHDVQARGLNRGLAAEISAAPAIKNHTPG